VHICLVGVNNYTSQQGHRRRRRRRLRRRRRRNNNNNNNNNNHAQALILLEHSNSKIEMRIGPSIYSAIYLFSSFVCIWLKSFSISAYIYSLQVMEPALYTVTILGLTIDGFGLVNSFVDDLHTLQEITVLLLISTFYKLLEHAKSS
jgi:hypothetical protein